MPDKEDKLREIDLYIGWLSENNLESTELTIISFVLQRGGIESGSRLFDIWLAGQDINVIQTDHADQVRRFFVNPTSAPFDLKQQNGWIDFFLLAYSANGNINKAVLSSPVFSHPGI